MRKRMHRDLFFSYKVKSGGRKSRSGQWHTVTVTGSFRLTDLFRLCALLFWAFALWSQDGCWTSGHDRVPGRKKRRGFFFSLSNIKIFLSEMRSPLCWASAHISSARILILGYHLLFATGEAGKLRALFSILWESSDSGVRLSRFEFWYKLRNVSPEGSLCLSFLTGKMELEIFLWALIC